MSTPPVPVKVRIRRSEKISVPGKENTISGRIEKKPRKAPAPKKDPITGRSMPSINSKDKKYQKLNNTLKQADKALEAKDDELKARADELTASQLQKTKLSKTNQALTKKLDEAYEKLQGLVSQFDAQNNEIMEKVQQFDTLKNYVEGFRDWSEKFQKAAAKRHPTRPLYRNVKVLLVRWESSSLSEHAEPNIKRLGGVFENIYNYEVNHFYIPDNDSNSALSTWISSFLDGSTETLIIFHYCGHGGIGSKSRTFRWTASSRGPSMEVSPIQRLFEETESDALLLYDSCHSGTGRTDMSSEVRGATDLIASCGFQTVCYSGQSSFTGALTQHLISAAENEVPSTISELFHGVFTILKSKSYEGNKRATAPVHCKLTPGDSWDIIIQPLKEANQCMGIDPLPERREENDLANTTDAESCFDHGEWREWLRKAPPEAVEVFLSQPWMNGEDISTSDADNGYNFHSSPVTEDPQALNVHIEEILQWLSQIRISRSPLKGKKRKAEFEEESCEKRQCPGPKD